jgi:NAD-dependent SIR2 family protein deacetylase
MTKTMLRPIKVLCDNDEDDQFHDNLKGLKMSDTLIVAWTSKEIRQWRIQVRGNGKRIIVKDTLNEGQFLKLDDDDED